MAARPAAPPPFGTHLAAAAAAVGLNRSPEDRALVGEAGRWLREAGAGGGRGEEEGRTDPEVDSDPDGDGGGDVDANGGGGDGETEAGAKPKAKPEAESQQTDAKSEQPDAGGTRAGANPDAASSAELDLDLDLDPESGPRSRSDQNWDVRFAQLRAYQQEHGHTNVPKKEGSLGHWVAWQRKRNRQIQDGTRKMRQVTIWAEKRTRLDSIGFSWIGPHGGRSRRVPAELSEGGWRGQFQVAEEEAAECILAASAAFLAWILADGGGGGAARRVGRTASLAASLPAAFVRYLAGGPLVLADALQVCHDAVARSGGGDAASLRDAARRHRRLCGGGGKGGWDSLDDSGEDGGGPDGTRFLLELGTVLGSATEGCLAGAEVAADLSYLWAACRAEHRGGWAGLWAGAGIEAGAERVARDLAEYGSGRGGPPGVIALAGSVALVVGARIADRSAEDGAGAGAGAGAGEGYRGAKRRRMEARLTAPSFAIEGEMAAIDYLGVAAGAVCPPPTLADILATLEGAANELLSLLHLPPRAAEEAADIRSEMEQLRELFPSPSALGWSDLCSAWEALRDAEPAGWRQTEPSPRSHVHFDFELASGSPMPTSSMVHCQVLYATKWGKAERCAYGHSALCSQTGTEGGGVRRGTWMRPMQVVVYGVSSLPAIRSGTSLLARSDRRPPMTESMELNEFMNSLLLDLSRAKRIKPSARLRLYLNRAGADQSGAGAPGEAKWMGVILPLLNGVIGRISSRHFNLFPSTKGEPIPSDAMRLNERGELNLTGMNFASLYPGPISDDLFAAALLSLYYFSLESILYDESARLRISSHPKLILNAEFHRCLLAISCVCVLRATGISNKRVGATERSTILLSFGPVDVESVLDLMGCDAYSYLKVSESFVRSARQKIFGGLPVALKHHIIDVEEYLLQSCLWIDRQMQTERNGTGVGANEGPFQRYLLRRLDALSDGRIALLCAELPLQTPFGREISLALRRILRSHVHLLRNGRSIDDVIAATAYAVGRMAGLDSAGDLFSRIVDAFELMDGGPGRRPQHGIIYFYNQVYIQEMGDYFVNSPSLRQLAGARDGGPPEEGAKKECNASGGGCIRLYLSGSGRQGPRSASPRRGVTFTIGGPSSTHLATANVVAQGPPHTFG
jgi:hypothetical protein